MNAAAVQWADPGPVGFAVGGLLIIAAVGLLWLWFARRRLHAEAVAEVGVARGTSRTRHLLVLGIALANALAVWLLSATFDTRRVWPGVVVAFLWSALWAGFVVRVARARREVRRG
ncbi:hypothetical protein AB0L22_08640 [Micromonospora haikouensis]|uniref:hypothetical protein n=1 Tax=Micromonospora haikouensis TaxID=686309 RepID=UPI0034499C86